MPLESLVGPQHRENILQEALFPLTRALSWITGATRQLNRATFPFDIVPQIEKDIETLEDGSHLANHELPPACHEARRKYEYEYFPFPGYRLLTLENKFRYMQLRIRIDEVLERDYIYNDNK